MTYSECSGANQFSSVNRQDHLQYNSSQKMIFCLLDTPTIDLSSLRTLQKKLGLLWSIYLSSNQNKPSYTLTDVIQTNILQIFRSCSLYGNLAGRRGLESVLVLERDTKTHSAMRVRYSAHY